MVSPPIIVIDGHDFSFYESLDAVGRHLETWYPEEPYVAYDGVGRRLELAVEERTVPRRWFRDRKIERVGVRALEEEPSDPGVLAGLLREHLQRAGVDVGASASLPELVDRSIERSGYT
jgi:hypothetical protein